MKWERTTYSKQLFLGRPFKLICTVKQVFFRGYVIFTVFTVDIQSPKINYSISKIRKIFAKRDTNHL